MNPDINHPHDKFFKAFFSRKQVVSSFIEEYLLKQLECIININSLQPVQNDSVDIMFDEFYSDLVFSAEILSTKSRIYLLFEHKSYSDSQVGRQLDDYMHVLQKNHLKLHPGDNKLINIIPIFIYHGSQKWNLPADTVNLYEPLDNSRKYTPDFKYELFDISHMPDNQIIGNTLLKIVLFTLKYIESPELINKINNILVLFKELSEDVEFTDYLTVFTRYLENSANPNLREQMVRIVIKWFQKENSGMSRIMGALESEGMQKGMQKGVKKGLEKGFKEGEIQGEKKGKSEAKIEDAQKMLQKGMSIELIKEITGLPIAKIEEIKNRFL